MNAIKFGYSLKNIPLPSITHYRLVLMQKTEQFLKLIRWEAFFYLRKLNNPGQNFGNADKITYGFKTSKCPPPIEETKEFESDVWKLTENIKLEHISDTFQNQLKRDVQKIKASDKIIVQADKTGNFYEYPKPDYQRIVHNSVTTSYKKCDPQIPKQINDEAKTIASKLDLEKRINTLAEQQCFVTVKDHKEDFRTNPKFRLINPTKSEIGKISKMKLEKINTQIRQITKTNQWQNTNATINWFKNIQNKNNCNFIIFDIAEFYPSISKQLLLDSLNYAREYVQISTDDIDIIMHSRKALLYSNKQPWIKRHGDPNFDVTMGSFDGAELSELTGLFLLSELHAIIPKEDIGLYRDDGLGVIRNTNGQKGERIRKKFIEIFKKHGLKIEIKLCKTADFLDVTFDLRNNTFKPFQKPNSDPKYVNVLSNHPMNIIKQIPNSISKRISNNSATKEIFEETADYYNDLLQKSGHKDKISYTKEIPKNKRKNRRRSIIWYNPPFNKNVKSKIGFHFINLVDKHFGDKGHILNKIFNRNRIKISFSCMPNMGQIIKSHNAKLLNKNNDETKECNCRIKSECPLNGECMVDNIVYSARVTTQETDSTSNHPITNENDIARSRTSQTRTTRASSSTNNSINNNNNGNNNNGGTNNTYAEPPTPNQTTLHNTQTKHYQKEAIYIGAAEHFKDRYRNHTKSFRHEVYRKDTELSKHIWKLIDKKINYKIEWKILKRTSGYNKVSKVCNLCLSEKFEIFKFKNKNALLNKRSELVSKCRHENKYLLSNLPDP